MGVGAALEEQARDHESGHCIRIEAAIAGNSMAYDSFGSTASALSGYSLTLVETRRACPGLVYWLRPGAYPIATASPACERQLHGNPIGIGKTCRRPSGDIDRLRTKAGKRP